MSDLLPCPFCGGTAKLEREFDADMERWHYVECQKCGARTKGHWVAKGNDCPQWFQERRDEWNRRAVPNAAAETSSRLSTSRAAEEQSRPSSAADVGPDAVVEVPALEAEIDDLERRLFAAQCRLSYSPNYDVYREIATDALALLRRSAGQPAGEKQ